MASHAVRSPPANWEYGRIGVMKIRTRGERQPARQDRIQRSGAWLAEGVVSETRSVYC
jgi:hypothetical protein